MKKILNILCLLLLVVTTFFAVVPVSYAADETSSAVSSEYFNDTENVGENFCSEPSVKKTLKFFAFLIILLKLFVPIIIIVKGTFLFYNAVVKGGTDDITKNAKDLGIKILIGVMVFFVPDIINAVMGLYNDWAAVESEYTECATCLLEPDDC